MKRFLKIGVAIVAAMLVFSCTPTQNSFDKEFLYGKWVEKSGTLHYRYDADFTGVTWDTADDVTEAEGKRFEWTLVSSELTHIYITEIDASGTKAAVPKVYKVTTLTEDLLVYEDDYSEYSFTKVRQ